MSGKLVDCGFVHYNGHTNTLKEDHGKPVLNKASARSLYARGLIAGSTLGLVNLLNPYTIGIFVGLLALGSLALLFADRSARPILERVSADLSERE